MTDSTQNKELTEYVIQQRILESAWWDYCTYDDFGTALEIMRRRYNIVNKYPTIEDGVRLIKRSTRITTIIEDVTPRTVEND